MSIHQLKTKQIVPASLKEVWEFMENPRNLKKITPDYMGFDIVSQGLPEKMHTGLLIEYKVSPVLKLPMTWLTEITHLQEQVFFVDEQRVGPYKLWHHQHHFEETAKGVLMRDIVSYQLPFGPIGDFTHQMFVKKQLLSIFDYRYQAVEDYFG